MSKNPQLSSLARALAHAKVISCRAPIVSQACRRQIVIDDHVVRDPMLAKSYQDRVQLERKAIAGAGWFQVAGASWCPACYVEAVDAEDLDDGVIVATEVDRRELLAIEVRP